MLKKLKIFIPIAVTAIILWFIFNKFDLGLIKSVYENSNLPVLFISSFLLITIAPFITAMRVRSLLKIVNCDLSAKQALILCLGIMPLSKISPANSGELIRNYYLKDRLSMSLNTGCLIYERINDFFVISFLSLLFGLINKNIYSIILGGGVLVLILLLFVIGAKFKNKSSNKLFILAGNFFSIFKLIATNKIVFF